MKNNKIILKGWQSWSNTNHKKYFLKRIRNYSPFDETDSVATNNHHSLPNKPIYGWSSWPSTGTKVTEKYLLSIAQWFANHKKEAPIEYIQIDDGWTTWGDWNITNLNKFPNGLKQTVQKNSELGFKTGLWVAPFLADPKSELFKKHPDWFIKNRLGFYPNGKKNYFFDFLLPDKKYILNLELDDAYAYILNCFKTIINDWKVSLLKVDFLYAGHFYPKYSNQSAPDKLLSKLLKDIRNINKNIYIMACGCPLKPAAGLVNSMRISDDVLLPPLKNTYPLNQLVHKMRLRQLINNFHNRAETKELWQIDPDIFACHKSFGLSKNQTYIFQKITKKSRGVIFLGDNMPEINKMELENYIYPLFK